MRDRAHERLVRVAHVRVDHVVVPLVDRQIDRLADRAARVVQERRHVRKLHEVAEVLDRAVATATLEIADERRAVGRREDGGGCTEVHGGGRVARVLVELLGRRRLNELSRESSREANPFTVDVAAGLSQEFVCVGRLAEVDPDGLEDRVGVVLDRREAFLVDDLERFQRPGDEGDLLRDFVQAGRTAPLAAAAPAAASLGLAHEVLLSRVRRRRWASAGARSGSGTRAPRRGKGSVAWGMPIAPTKCSWNRGSVAVSIFSTRRTTSSISSRAARLSRAIRAPVPAALPALVTCSGSQSGTRPSTIAWTGSIWAPKAPASRMRSTRSSP